MFESHNEAIHELLKNQGLVRPQRLDDLKQRSLSTGVSLADAVLEEGLIERGPLLAGVAAYLGTECIPEVPDELSLELKSAVSGEIAQTHGVVPVAAHGQTLDVLAVDPFRPELEADLAFVLGRPVRQLVADPGEVKRLLRRSYGEDEGQAEEAAPGTVVDAGPAGTRELSASDLESMAGQAPVIRLVNRVLARAIRDHASDVHFEPFEHDFKIRYRVDGALYDLTPPPKAMGLSIASRIKVLADLDIAERRLPQDGRIRTTLGGRSVDLRVSTLPTQFGESIVLRVLDQSAGRLELAQLGLPPTVRAGVEAMLRRPNGIFVVTGPTGSGKTTTLYSGLRALNATEIKILTAEDPVEYEIEGIMQVPVNPAAGLNFAKAMRAFLRQDPDVIMVGEIRDVETARMAIQAALTGHLVLSTLHTNDAPSAVTRLLDLGVEPFLVASALEGVLAQRLLRRNCAQCRVPAAPSPELRRQIGFDGGESLEGKGMFFRGAGCPACGRTGYRGRVGIYEWLPMTEAVRALVTGEVSAHAIRGKAMEQGMRTLRAEALRLALEGETTLEEVLRHT